MEMLWKYVGSAVYWIIHIIADFMWQKFIIQIL